MFSNLGLFLERTKCYASFVPIEIQHYSEQNHIYIHTIKCKEIGLTISLLSSKKFDLINWVKKLVYRAITMKLLFGMTEPVHIRILDTPFKKKFNVFKKSKRILGPREINSGFTTGVTNEIVLIIL